MANHKSALKRAKQSEIRRIRNKAVKTRVKNVTKVIQLAAADNSTDEKTRAAELNRAKSEIDRASKKGVIHKRTASRKISRLTKLLNRAVA